jgi:aminopeptidase N
MDEFVKLFKMPIVFEAHYTDGSFDSRRQFVDQESVKVVVPNPQKKAIAFVLFDPGSNVLKTVTFQKSFEELQAQALHAPFMIDRYDAVKGMTEFDINMKRDVLAQIYHRENFHYVKSAVVPQLVNDSAEASRSLMREALHDPAPEVRKAVIDSVRDIPASLRSNFENLLADSSYEIVLGALTKLADQFPDHLPRYLAATEGVEGTDRKVKLKRFELSAAAGNKASLDSLVAYSSSSYEFRSRLVAFESLKRLDYLDDRLLPNLFDAMTHWNRRLKAPATVIATSFYEKPEYQKLFRAYYQSHVWLPYQKLILENFVKE